MLIWYYPMSNLSSIKSIKIFYCLKFEILLTFWLIFNLYKKNLKQINKSDYLIGWLGWFSEKAVKINYLKACRFYGQSLVFSEVDLPIIYLHKNILPIFLQAIIWEKPAKHNIKDLLDQITCILTK